VLSAVLALAITTGAVPSSTDAAASPSDEHATARAKAEIDEARAQAAEGHYREALTHFEAALALRPSPALHYNIAVCHHRLLLEMQESDPGYEEARRAAVDAYNRYLAAAPNAPDRDAVGQTVFELGGRPVTLDDWSIEPDTDAPTGTPELRLEDAPPASDATDEPRPAPTPAPPPPAGDDTPTEPTAQFPRGRVGFGLSVGIANIRRMSDADGVAALPYVGGIIRGGAFIGPRRRLNLGGELALQGQPTGTKTEHFFGAGSLGFVAEFAHPVGAKQRVEIGGGGLVALGREAMRHRGDTTAMCPDDAQDVVSARLLGILGGRFVLSVLLGERRQHELGFRLTPAIGLPGAGSKSDDDVPGCEAGPRPFDELRLAGPELVMTFDVGYAPRF
jgi:hypothetical protein